MDKKKGGFGLVDKTIIFDASLTPEARLIYTAFPAMLTKTGNAIQVLKH